MRTIVVGDVHGCIDELKELLVMLDVRPSKDRLIYLGDLIDRGPDPVGVVRLVRESGNVSCLGNHELNALRWARYEAARKLTGARNPMRPFDDKRRVEHEAFLDEDRAWMERMPLWLDFTDGGVRWIATHAGVPSDVPIGEQDVKKLVRTRMVDEETGEYASTGNPHEVPEGAVYWAKRWRGPESIVHGHIVHDDLGVRRDTPVSGVECLGIDTGCCFGGSLTAAIFTGTGFPSFMSVKAKRVYLERRRDKEAA